MFIDASALCAILLGEADADTFADRIDAADVRLTSAVAILETTLTLLRRSGDMAAASRRVRAFLQDADIRVVQIGEREGEVAVDAYGRFGKGRHPARLNMGDCFAYACARTNNASLLFKGDDFALTDVVGP